MSSTNERGESFRVFEGTPEYVEGYIPSSFFDAQHSPLQRASTWIGMSFILSIVTGLGSLSFGLATYLAGTQANAHYYIIAGIVITVGFAIIGTALIKYGCRYGRAFKRQHPELYAH